MKKIVVWGLGREYTHYKNIIQSKEILGKNGLGRDEYEIIGYCDIARKDIKDYVSPEDIPIIHPDIIVTSKFLKQDISGIINEQGSMTTAIVESFEEIIDERLSVNKKAVGNGRASVDRYLRMIKERSDIDIKVIFEIGANYGQDAEYCRLITGAEPYDVYTFEANPRISSYIQKKYTNNNYNVAVSNYDGKAMIKMVPDNSENSGISTIAEYDYAKEYETREVQCIRMDTFLKDRPDIRGIDFLKLDVEGVNYEVLEGFGDKLDIVKCIQTEADHVAEFEEHRLFNLIYDHLYKNGFEMVDYVLHKFATQSDSLWIRRNLLKRKKI